MTELKDSILKSARKMVSHQYGVKESALVYAYKWEVGTDTIISFWVDQPGNGYDGSTLSCSISSFDNQPGIE